jgi:F0F1-type ATP synthase assembly protein I
MIPDRQDDTNIERRQDLQHDEEAFRLRQEEKRLRAARLNTSIVYSWIGVAVFMGLWILGISIHISALHVLIIFALIGFCYSVFIVMRIGR